MTKDDAIKPADLDRAYQLATAPILTDYGRRILLNGDPVQLGQKDLMVIVREAFIAGRRATAHIEQGEAYGFVVKKGPHFIWAAEWAATERNQALLASGEVVRVYTHPAPVEAQPVAWADANDICQLPPEGWYCTRKAGHDGPCAAHQHEPDRELDADDHAAIAQGMARLKPTPAPAAGSIGDDAKFRRLIMDWHTAKSLGHDDTGAAWHKLREFLDARSQPAAAPLAERVVEWSAAYVQPPAAQGDDLSVRDAAVRESTIQEALSAVSGRFRFIPVSNPNMSVHQLAEDWNKAVVECRTAIRALRTAHVRSESLESELLMNDPAYRANFTAPAQQSDAGLSDAEPMDGAEIGALKEAIEVLEIESCFASASQLRAYLARISGKGA